MKSLIRKFVLLFERSCSGLALPSESVAVVSGGAKPCIKIEKETSILTMYRGMDNSTADIGRHLFTTPEFPAANEAMRPLHSQRTYQFAGHALKRHLLSILDPALFPMCRTEL
jgi:hypothetical protein